MRAILALVTCAALGVAVGVPSASPTIGREAARLRCDYQLSKVDADIVLRGLTKWVDPGAPRKVREWPKLTDGGTSCLWQGQRGQLTLRVYDWPDAEDRQEFARNLCRPLYTSDEMCGKSRAVRREQDARDASLVYRDILANEAQEAGNATRVAGTRWSYVFVTQQSIAGPNKLATFGWGPASEDIMLAFVCLSFKDMGDQAEQARCVRRALQLADAQ